jgi:hypothetical protein
MRLIAHAAAQGNRTERVTRRQHQPLGHFYASAREILMCRHGKCGLECPAEVADAEGKQRREIFDPDSFGQVGIDMRRQASGLP